MNPVKQITNPRVRDSAQLNLIPQYKTEKTPKPIMIAAIAKPKSVSYTD